MSRQRLGVALAAVLLLLLALAPTAHASGAPAVFTEPANAVAGGGEKLNGFVNPEGAATTYHFEYGPSVSFGRSTPNASAGSGTTYQAQSATITGLTPGTTYYFRIVATNASGTGRGVTDTFIAGQPQVSTLAATNIVGQGATLNGTVNPEGSSTTYRFDYGTDTTYSGGSTPTQNAGSGGADVSESATLTNLTPGTTYHYRVEATNVAGTVMGNDQVFTPGQAQATTGFASAITATAATLNGSVNPAGLDTMYHFDYGNSTNYGSSTSTQDAGPGVAPVAVSAPVAALTTGSTYHFRLVATNAGGTVWGADQSFTPGQAQAFTLAATAVGQSGAALNGTVNPGGQSTTYRFDYGTDTTYSVGSTAVRQAGAGSADVSATEPIGGLLPSTTYHYRVMASNSAGPIYGSDATFTTSSAGPQAPSVTQTPATAVADNGATLNGAINPNGQATTYQFEYGRTTGYGSTTPAQDAGSGSSPVAGWASITGLTSSTTYHYRLVATNATATTQGTDQTLTTTGPPPPPTVTPALATSVTDTTATLNATVNPNGLATTYQFQYGTNTNYGTTTPSQSAGAGTTDQTASAPVTGLTAGTTYHFRVVATSASGPTNGPDGSFTTPVPPTPTTTAATGLSDTGATLNGTVNPNGFATSYDFEYGTDTSYGTTTAAQSAGSGMAAQAAATTLTGLSPGTTFHFRIVATNGADIVPGADQSFTTTGQALPPTVTPSPATSVTDTGATLNGAINPNGQATTYQFQYGPDTNYGTSGTSVPASAASAGSGATLQAASAPTNALTPGTTYHFRLVASSPAGTSPGPDGTFTTPVPPTPTTTAATAVTDTGAMLNGSVNPNGFATSYSFQYGTDLSYGTTTASQGAGSGTAAQAVAAALIGLSPGTTFHFRVVASNGGGDTVYGGDQTFTTPIPPAAVTAAATGVTTTGAALNGSVNPNGFATSYSFQYGTDLSYGTTTASQGAGSGTAAQAGSAALTGLTPATTYHFRIVASNGADVVNGNDQTFTTPQAPQKPAVTTSSADTVTDTTANLNGTVNPNGQVTTYQFQYGPDTNYGTSVPASAASAGAGTSVLSESAPIAALTPGTTYHFRLVATNPTGTTNGPDATLTTPAPPSATTGAASNLSATAASVNATVNPNGFATTYHFDYGTSLAYGSVTSSRAAGAGSSSQAVSAALAGLTPGTTYHFRVVATNGVDTVAGLDQSFTTPPPPTVSTGGASSVTSADAVVSGSVDSNGQATTYQFQYGTDTGYGSSTPSQGAGSAPGPQGASATLTALAPATTYHYRLVATSASGTSQGADQTFTTAAVQTGGGGSGGGGQGGGGGGGSGGGTPGGGNPQGPPPGSVTPPAGSGAPTVTFGGPISERLAGQTVVVVTGITVSCPTGGSCSVNVAALGQARVVSGTGARAKHRRTPRQATLASSSGSVASGRTLSITVNVRAPMLRRLLKGRARLPMTVTLTVRGADGQSHSYNRVINLRKPRKATVRL